MSGGVLYHTRGHVKSILYGVKNILRTSAASPTNLGSKLIFASCVVGTCNTPYGLSFFLGGVQFFVHNILVSVGIVTSGGEF